MNRFLNIIHKIIEIFISVSFAVITSIVIIQIITRHVFFYSLVWSEELSRYLFIWVVFIGACFGVKDGSQISVDVIDTILKKKNKRGLTILQILVQLITCLVMLFLSIQFIINCGIGQRSPAMHLPMTFICMCVPICFILVLLELITKLSLISRNNLKDIKTDDMVENWSDN